jgi:hypothetical protein
MARVPLFSTTFDEGRLFDLWMLVHSLAGVAGGFANVWFGLATPTVFLVGVALMLAWELFEYIAGVRESWENRVLDIVVGLLGVALALAIARRLGSTGQWYAFAGSVALLALGSALGWRAYRRRRARRRPAAA